MQFPEITAPELAYFDPGDGRRIGYRYRAPKAGGPTALFVDGTLRLYYMGTTNPDFIEPVRFALAEGRCD